jgi:hypothetical protein
MILIVGKHASPSTCPRTVDVLRWQPNRMVASPMNQIQSATKVCDF